MFAKELARVIAPLADSLAMVAEPGAALFHKVVRDAQIQQIALARDPFTVEDVKLRFTKRRCDFVLDYLGPRTVADGGVAVLDGGDAANVHSHRRVELQ